MRDIKFRAWHKNIKEMFEVGQITLKKGIWDYQPEDRKYIGMSIPYQPSFILMQYTGLHDKNGKEIYEGDIVKITENILKQKVIRLKPIIADIEWSEEYLTYTLITTSVKDAFESLTDYLDEYDIEVIGNIYENKELLEGE